LLFFTTDKVFNTTLLE